MTLRIGELFAGYGGLGMGVQATLGGDIAWTSEIDPGASKILAHRFPGVPNHGDITQIDWTQVEPVDVLTGGFPCQDVSAAGKRAGIRPDTRSGLWSQFAYAIEMLWPRLVVIENVRGLLSADAHHPAHSDLEPCPWCMGDAGPDRPLRALGAVLGELADIGYDASWQGLRASDVGAPHGRFRVFILAWPATDTEGGDRRPGRDSHPAERQQGHAESGGGVAADASGGELQRRGVGGVVAGTEGAAAGAGDQRQRDGHAAGDQRAVAQDPNVATWGERRLAAPGQAEGRGARTDAGGRDRAPAAQWGPYTDAIRRWERVTRPAPRPTEPGKTGERLSPLFVEWMMGLPVGWVTDVPGLNRNAQLKALGNGVVPQQAAEAVRLLLPDVPSSRVGVTGSDNRP